MFQGSVEQEGGVKKKSGRDRHEDRQIDRQTDRVWEMGTGPTRKQHLQPLTVVVSLLRDEVRSTYLGRLLRFLLTLTRLRYANHNDSPTPSACWAF